MKKKTRYPRITTCFLMSRQQIAAGELRIAGLLGFSPKHAGSEKHFCRCSHHTDGTCLQCLYGSCTELRCLYSRIGENQDSRVRRWRLRWVVRVNFAGQCGQSFVWGRTGILPLCERILDTAPSFLYSMTVRACGTVTEGAVGSAR